MPVRLTRRAVARASPPFPPFLRGDNLLVENNSKQRVVRRRWIPRTEIDKNISPSFTLPHRKSHYATDIVVLGTPFLFAEISDEPGAKTVDLGHHIEQERLNVIEKALMIQKQFRQ